ILPLVMRATWTWPCSRPGWSNSAAYFACPVTLAGPSTRLSGVPKPAWVMFWVIARVLSCDPLVHTALRRRTRGLIERAHDRAACKRYLEVVVALADRFGEDRVGDLFEKHPRRRFLRHQRLGLPVAPGLVRHAAERKAGLGDHPLFKPQGRRHRHQREGVGMAVAQLEIGVVRVEAVRRQLDRRDEFAGLQRGILLRCVARQAV